MFPSLSNRDLFFLQRGLPPYDNCSCQHAAAEKRGSYLNRWFCSRRTNKALAESLDQAVDPQDPLVNRLLRMMATTAMSQALYFSTGLESQDQYYHYGMDTVPSSCLIISFL